MTTIPTTTTIGSMCWCEATEVLIPVEWVREGRTLSCDRESCWQGCDPAGTEDAFEVTFPEGASAPVPIPHEGKGLVLEWGPGLCWCGCGQPVKRLFLQGHDHRMLGALVRALRADEVLTIVEPETGAVVEAGVNPLDWVARIDQTKHTKVNWVNKIKERV